MITKILRRFCSPEVEMMLKHLEEHPEDFREIVGYSTWNRLADAVRSEGTYAEKRVLRAVMAKAFKRLNRQKLLGAIVTQTIAPMSVEAYEDEAYGKIAQQYSTNLAQSMANTKATIQQGLMNSQFQNQQGLMNSQLQAQQRSLLAQYLRP